MPPTTQQYLAIGEELRTAVRLIHGGLGQLQHLSVGNDFYHLPILTLASGFERLMKVILCFWILEQTGEFPKRGDIPEGRKGHDLPLLLKRIQDECFPGEDVSTSPAAQEDLGYLSSDELRPVIVILGDFGQAARYYYLDVVVGKEPLTNAPDAEWRRLEGEIVSQRPALLREIEQNPATTKVYELVTTEVIVRLERFARALARILTHNKEATRFLTYADSFRYLQDEELGKRTYSPVGVS